VRGRAPRGDGAARRPGDLSQGALEQLLQDTPEGIYRYRLEPTRGFEYVNRTLTELTGFTAAEFRTDRDLALSRVHPDDRHLVHELRTIPGGHPGGVEVRFQHRDGRWMWHWVREVAAPDDDGCVRVVHGAVTDVTSYKRDTEVLRGQIDEHVDHAAGLRRVSELRDAFLRAVSHELRTPLTSIVGFSRMLGAHGEEMSAPDRADVVARLSRNAERLQGLVDDLLDVDVLGESHVTAHRHPVELQPLVQTIVDTLADDDDARCVHVDVPAVTVQVDGPKVSRILSHLLRNALRHTPSRTHVEVRARIEAATGTLVLTVADDGPGIPAHLRETVLDPFTQGEEARSQASPGTGVGLALVSRFARLHGGGVTVGERLGGGTEVVVTLPGSPRVVVDVTAAAGEEAGLHPLA
jgi:PAS domain S-box-containing protein